MASEGYGYERLSPRPIPNKIVKQMQAVRDSLNASTYSAWIKVTSGTGLTLISNPNQSLVPTTTSEVSIHGGYRNDKGYEGTIGTVEADPKGTPWQKISTTFEGIPYKPRPVVESIEVKNGKHGLSKKATINIKCFTIKQLTEMAKHFLEPGFSIAIQWGWNRGGQLGIISGDPENFAKINNFEENQKRKVNTSGCKYENFIGTITGGNLTVNDNSFELMLEATGLGELALNLQMINESAETEDSTGNDVSDSGWQSFINGVSKAAKGFGNIVIKSWTAITNFYNSATPTQIYSMPFLHMYGSLPPELQTPEIKDLASSAIGSWRNFVGFNEEALEKFGQYGWIRSWLTGKTGPSLANVDLGDDNLIDRERFIRFGALMGILEKVPYDLKKGINLAGANNYSLIINTEKVPIRAFKRIFSIDKSKLLILNQHTPDFGLSENFTNPSRNPASVYVIFGNQTNFSSTTPPFPTVNTTYPLTSSPWIGHFPYPEALTVTSADPVSPGNLIEAPKWTWGYLEDLYVNFDFAIEIIKTPGILAKDGLQQILNGMSSAVNNFWDFQVVEDVDPTTKQIRLSVVDMNFSEFGNKTYPKFYHTGVESIFKTISYTIDIPSAMKNQIIAKRLAVSDVSTGGTTQYKAKFNPFLPDPDPTLWGSSYKDLLFEPLSKSAGYGAGSNPPPPPPPANNAITLNAREFVKKAGIYLKTVDPAVIKGTSDAEILALVRQEFIYVGTFSDSAIFDYLKTIELNGVDHKRGATNTAPGILLPLGVNFTAPGVGGLEFGYSFQLHDTLDKFKDTGIFQITDIIHTVSDSFWEVSVETKFRPL